MAQLSNALRTLLAGIVDYAGLFPPARLDMRAAVEQYESHRRGPYHWMLGRFIVPVARLAELEAAVQGLCAAGEQRPWRLSALGGEDLGRDGELIEAFNRPHAAPTEGRAVIDTIEFRAGSVAEIESALRSVPETLVAYVEIPINQDPSALVRALAARGGRAKVRTGGITGDAFPAADELARFLGVCAAARLPFKATAGLHHPLRTEARLTYEPGSPSATMFGFLNLFLGAAFARSGLPADQLIKLLEERSAEAIRFVDDGVSWNGHRLGTADLAATRLSGATAFGSCSFEEPVNDLRGLGLL